MVKRTKNYDSYYLKKNPIYKYSEYPWKHRKKQIFKRNKFSNVFFRVFDVKTSLAGLLNEVSFKNGTTILKWPVTFFF